MIFLSCLLAINSPVSVQADVTEAANALIQKMSDRYTGAHSVSGTINLTVQAQGLSQTILSKVQFERPNKLFLYQERSAPEPKSWLVTSDGDLFSYPLPEGIIQAASNRLVEHATTLKDGPLSWANIYAAVVDSIGDRSAPLGFIVQWKPELVRIENHWLKFDSIDSATVNDKKTSVIVGEYTGAYGKVPTGKFTLVVSDDGDLVDYKVVENLAGTDPQTHQTVIVAVTEDWVCNLTVDGKVDESLFKLVK